MAVSTLPQQEAMIRIKHELSEYLGRQLKLSTVKSRGVLWECEGTLDEVYPNLFVLDVEENHEPRKISYSYADILTKTIRLVCCDTGENVFHWLPDRY